MDLAKLAWLIPAFSFIAFFLTVIFGRFLPGKGSWIAILAIGGGFVVFWIVLVGFLGADCPRAFGQETCNFSREWFTAGDVILTWGIIVDPLSIVMLGLVTLVGLMVQLYSLGYMKGDPRLGWYFAVHALFIGSMLALVLADNFLLLYVVWELVGLCSYLLIGFWYERRSATEAAKKAFITTRIGDVGLLIGILLLFDQTGTFSMSATFEAATTGQIGQGTLTLAALLLFLGAMGKSAQFPLHVWLPDAMEGPTPVSALIHAATMVAAGVFLVARTFPIFEAVPDALTVVAIIGLITALMAASQALVSTDLKRILAYSTVSHLGLMMLSLGAFGYTAAIFHLMAHGFAKALLFLGAGSVMHSMKDETDIRKMGGLRKVMPVTAMTFTVGALSLAGAPLLAGFWSKDEVLLAVLDHRGYLLVFALLAAFLSSMYMARALFQVFYGKLKDENHHVHESPPIMLAPMLLLAALATVVGFLSLKATDTGGFGTFLFFNKAHGFEFNIALGVGSALLTLAAIWLGWAVYLKKSVSLDPWTSRFAGPIRVIANKYYLDDIYQWTIDKVILAVARIVAVFDRVAVNDIGVNGPADAVRWSGGKLRYHVTGRMSNYALGMVIGGIFVTIFWWLLSAR